MTIDPLGKGLGDHYHVYLLLPLGDEAFFNQLVSGFETGSGSLTGQGIMPFYLGHCSQPTKPSSLICIVDTN